MNILSENQQQLRVRSTWGRNYLKTFLLFRHDNRHPTFLFLSLSVCVRGSQWQKNNSVEDPTGLTGTEVDLEGYAEASEGHVPQGNQSFPEEVHEGEEFYGADEFMF
uniref:Uncharacterized protein n=1 Tax=Oryza glumipatula TaxID=40148 RepID=A0A0E0B8M6_9ORYZ